MSVNLPLFALAVALLWMPRSWLRRGPALWRKRHRHSVAHSWTHAPADGTTLSFQYEFSKARNYLDFFRAAVGTIALVGSNGATPALFDLPSAAPSAAQQVLFGRVAILGLGTLIQSCRWDRDRRRLSLAAPIFYVGGLTLGMPVPLAGACAFTIAWALVPVVPFTPGFLIVHALVFGAIATFIGGVSLLNIAAVGICVLPVLLSLLTRRPLLLYSRRPASTRATPGL